MVHRRELKQVVRIVRVAIDHDGHGSGAQPVRLQREAVVLGVVESTQLLAFRAPEDIEAFRERDHVRLDRQIHIGEPAFGERQ